MKILCCEGARQDLQNRPNEDFILIPNIINIIKLVAVHPATSATAERLFSLARYLNSWLQSTMLPARFNFLALLKVYKERTDNLNLRNIVNEFVSKENRLSLFGHFTDKDFQLCFLRLKAFLPFNEILKMFC